MTSRPEPDRYLRVDPSPRSFWERRWVLAIVVAAMALPLLFPAIPPLVDLPGHIGSYKVEVDVARSPLLAQWFSFHWAPVGNLGVDLLMLPLGRLLGVEPAVKLIVMAIPVITAAGMLLTAREIHGRLPATAFFALPLAYSFPFQFGFVNFALAIGLMFLSIGFWLRLGRLDRRGLRAVLFVPLGFVLFLAHCVAWAMLGLSLLVIEAAAAMQRGKSWHLAIRGAIVACLPLAASLLLMADWLLYRSGGQAGEFFGWSEKAFYLAAVLHDQSFLWDIFGTVVLYWLLRAGFSPRFGSYDPRLGFAALSLFAVYLLMPGLLMGAFFADMRMAAYVLAMALLAICPTATARRRDIIAIAGLLFLAARLATQTWSYVDLDGEYRRHLAALDHVPTGARIFTLSGLHCENNRWGSPRTEHLGAVAIARREAFVNGQWPMPGGRLLNVHYPAAGTYALDPSETFYLPSCMPPPEETVAATLTGLPMGAFDYVWLISIPDNLWPHDSRLRPVWRTSDGVLYRIFRQPAFNPGHDRPLAQHNRDSKT